MKVQKIEISFLKMNLKEKMIKIMIKIELSNLVRL